MEKEEDNLLYSFYILQSCDILHLFFKKIIHFGFDDVYIIETDACPCGP